MSFFQKTNPFALFLKLLIAAIVLWFFVLMMARCTTKKKITEINNSSSTVNDTVLIVQKETIRDTVIRLQADSTLFEAMIECDSNNQAYIRYINELQTGERIKTRIVFKDKILRIESHINADSIQMFWKDHYEKVYQKNTSEITTDTQKETVIVKTRWPWWLWVVVIGGGLGAIIYFAWPLIKKFINPMA